MNFFIQVLHFAVECGILNLNWQNKILKAVAEKDLVDGLKEDNLWIEFDKEKFYFF